MKKKIRDLTLKEVSEICSKRDRCKDCPVYNVCDIDYNSDHSQDFEQEIEVEEDE